MQNFVFDKKVCLQNIDYLAKKKKITRRQLEEAAGVSQGYFSRLVKDGNDTKLTVDFIMKIANLLKVTPNTLLLKQLDKESDKVAVKIEFIYKLIADTKNNKLNWFYPTKSFKNMRAGQRVYTTVGNAFMCSANEKDMFILVKVKNDETNSVGYCIALSQNDQFINMCFTLDTDKPNYTDEMEELYKLVLSRQDQTNLNGPAFAAMQRFLGQ